MSNIRRVPIPILTGICGTEDRTRGDTVRLQAVTYPGVRAPDSISWELSNSNIVAIEPDSVDASMAWAIAFGDGEIAVEDSEIADPPEGGRL